MRRIHKLIVLPATAALGLLLIAGCSSDEPDQPAGAPATSSPAAPTQAADPQPTGVPVKPGAGDAEQPVPSDQGQPPLDGNPRQGQVPQDGKPRQGQPDLTDPHRGHLTPTQDNLAAFKDLADCMRRAGVPVAQPQVGEVFDTLAMDESKAAGDGVYDKVVQSCPLYLKLVAPHRQGFSF